jgi:hypothetical protein
MLRCRANYGPQFGMDLRIHLLVKRELAQSGPPARGVSRRTLPPQLGENTFAARSSTLRRPVTSHREESACSDLSTKAGRPPRKAFTLSAARGLYSPQVL